jgi:F-type H+-transporting ATPase subunit b
MKKIFSTIALLGLLAFGVSFALSQEHAATPPATASQGQTAEAPQHGEAQAGQPENPNQAIGKELAAESKEAAGEASGNEEARFKESASVKWFARVTGLPLKAAYWVAVVINFLIVAGLIYWVAKSSVPAMFRNRTVSIQKGIEEARRASEDANNRLREVESRLARLDAEVVQIRSAAETDFVAEEQRIREQAVVDGRRVVETAEQEIAAAVKNARRELTGFAADLAVDLAGKKIQVSDTADQALVRRFVSQLGKDGK